MNRQLFGVVAMLIGVAMGWAATGRLGYPVSADDSGASAGAPFPATETRAATTGQAAAPSPSYAAFEWPAGTEYRLSDPSVAAYRASLAPLWTWQGQEGTYGDGQTRVRLLTSGDRVTGVEVIANATVMSNACLEAQLLYGLMVDGAGVEAACAGMWTREWAEGQGAQSQRGQ